MKKNRLIHILLGLALFVSFSSRTFADEQEEETTIDAEATISFIKDVRKGSVVVKYIVESDQKILEENTFTENVGDEYAFDFEDKSFPGYTYLKTIGNATGKYTLETQEVTFVYQKLKKDQYSLETKYLDTNGNKLEESSVVLGFSGEKYQSIEKKFSDYVLKEIRGDAPHGTFKNKNIVVEYVYEKTSPTNPNQGSGGVDKPNKGSHISKTPLPKTGETSNYYLVIIGLMAILIVTLAYLKSKRKNS